MLFFLKKYFNFAPRPTPLLQRLYQKPETWLATVFPQLSRWSLWMRWPEGSRGRGRKKIISIQCAMSPYLFDDRPGAVRFTVHYEFGLVGNVGTSGFRTVVVPGPQAKPACGVGWGGGVNGEVREGRVYSKYYKTIPLTLNRCTAPHPCLLQ